MKSRMVATLDLGPKAVASPDGAHLAVLLDGGLSLYALDTGRKLAREDVVGTDVVFVGPHLLVHASDGAGSLLTLLSVPSLAPVSVLELSVPTRIQASSSAYALLDQGDQTLMAQCTNATIAVAPLRPPAVFARAVGLEASQFVTFSARGAEVWDAATRRPLARLGLSLPADTAAVGLTNRGASLWIATSQPALHLARISDGRISTLRLDAQPRNVRSHPALAWVVAEVGDRTLAINLAVKEIEIATAGHGPIVAITPMRDRGTGAVLVGLEGDRLALRVVGSDGELTARAPTATYEDLTPVPQPVPRADPTAPVAEAVTAPRAMTVSERLAQRAGRTDAPKAKPGAAPSIGVRLDLSIEPSATPFPNPSGFPDPVPSTEPRPQTAAAMTASAPTSTTLAARAAVATSAPAPAMAAPVAPTAPIASTMPAAPAPRSIPPRAPRVAEPTGWRTALVDWARATTATDPGPAPILDGSPLQTLATRASLTPAAWQVLATLYGAWLDGRAEAGTSIGRLAELAARAGDDAWPEALGTGRLAELGLVRWALGRARLAAPTGDFLDGREPGVIELIGRGTPAALPEGLFRVEAEADESARATAGRLSRAHVLELIATVGTLALCIPEGIGRAARTTVEQGRLEAWLRGLAMATTADLAGLTARAGETLLWIVPPGSPDRPGAPPRWRP